MIVAAEGRRVSLQPEQCPNYGVVPGLNDPSPATPASLLPATTPRLPAPEVRRRHVRRYAFRCISAAIRTQCPRSAAASAADWRQVSPRRSSLGSLIGQRKINFCRETQYRTRNTTAANSATIGATAGATKYVSRSVYRSQNSRASGPVYAKEFIATRVGAPGPSTARDARRRSHRYSFGRSAGLETNLRPRRTAV